MATLSSKNPYTLEINWEVSLMSSDEVWEAIEVAHKAYLEWRDISSSTKKELFLKLRDELEADIEECRRLQTIEMWYLYEWGKKWLLWTANLIRWFANNFEEILASKEYEAEWLKVLEVYDPIWVIFGIAPWNFPFNQLLRARVPNIIAWNTQVYKHASSVPLVAQKIQELFNKAGFPRWVYTALFIPSSMSEEIISNKYIAWVNLTGSEWAGSQVGALAWRYLKRSVLELGWNDAMIILEDVDIDRAVEMAVNGRMRNGGQSCNNSKRILIPSKFYDTFVDKYALKMSSLKLWDPMDEDTQVQPLVDQRAVAEVDSQVKKSIESWARLVVGWEVVWDHDNFYTPTVLADVTPDTYSFNHEIFGPVASLVKYNSIDEAIDLANNSNYGLSGSVIWDNIEQAKKVALRVEWWMIFINSFAASRASLPFGWVKNSWYGKEEWPDGLKTFMNKKVILV